MTGLGAGIRAPREGAWGDVRSRSIWRWQLIFAASTVAAGVIYVLLSPRLFADTAFVGGISAIVVLSGAALVLPWHRMPASAVLVLPLVDAVAVGLMSQAGESRASLLWVFPVAWVATYYGYPSLLALLAVIGGVLAVDVVQAGISPAQSQRALILLLCFGFMGVTIHLGARRARAYRALLRRQLDQVERMRERAERQQRRIELLADTLDTGIALVDRDGVLLEANVAFLRMYDADAMSEFSPTGAVEYSDYRGAVVPPGSTIFDEAAAGSRLDERRTWLHGRDGRWRAIEASTRSVPEGDDGDSSTLVFIRDVTVVAESERDRETVAQIVSHELRNPLTAITGHVELLLERDDLPGDVRAQLAIVDSAGQRMERLITSTLEHYRPDSSQREAVSLRSIGQASVAAFAASAANAQIALTSDLPDEGVVWADAFALRQAIDNIVGNAVKYTARGGTVSVSVRTLAHGVRLTVSDSGIGMTHDDVTHVFDRGFRAASARASGIPGTGLGMAQVREVVDGHGGSLHIASEPGRGTTIALDLPSTTSGGDLG